MNNAVAPLLKVEDLRVSFDVFGIVREAVRGVAFELRRGQVLALVGESGSGKSVSAMSVLGLLPSNAQVSGSILLDGADVITASADELRALRGGTIGTIFQEPTSALNPVFKVGAQLVEAIRVHQKISKSAAKTRTLELLDVVGLPEPHRVASSYPHQISGGQLQRAMIAMALSNDPQILIADEPTTALDVTVQAGILDALRSLREQLDMAILLITHDMGVVADLADDVVVLRHGEVVERADVFELFASPQHPYTRELLASVPSLVVSEPHLTSSGEPAQTPVAPRTSTHDAVVEAKDLVVEYSGRRGHSLRAVDHASFTVERGEILALVGESGSGKSTIGKALAGLLPIAGGSTAVAGVDIATASRSELREVRKRIGFVFQDPASSLNPKHSVGRSIAQPLTLHTDMKPEEIRSRVADLLEEVSLSRSDANRFPHELSGGQRQRVAIARAIALGPDLLIADEPTSALDVSVQATVLDLFRELQRKRGFGCVFISHNLAVVDQLADRVAVMHRGVLVEQGRTAQVLRSPQEPYTRQLLSAVLEPDPMSRRRTRPASHAGAV